MKGSHIYPVESPRQIADARDLLSEYGQLRDFDEALGDYDKELDELPGVFGPPQGCLLIAYVIDRPAGCVAYRKIKEGIVEMKRLYVRDMYREARIGQQLVDEIILKAKEGAYAKMRLDTHPWMLEAQGLYENAGFKEVSPYNNNPTEGIRFFELEL